MTAADILARDNEDTIELEGAAKDEWCDLFERESPDAPDVVFLMARRAPCIIGRRLPRTWLDEIPRLLLCEAFGREWLAEMP